VSRRGPRRTALSGADLLVVHVRLLLPDERLDPPPQERLSDRVGPGLAGLLVRALTGDHDAPRRALRV